MSQAFIDWGQMMVFQSWMQNHSETAFDGLSNDCVEALGGSDAIEAMKSTASSGSFYDMEDRGAANIQLSTLTTAVRPPESTTLSNLFNQTAASSGLGDDLALTIVSVNGVDAAGTNYLNVVLVGPRFWGETVPVQNALLVHERLHLHTGADDAQLVQMYGIQRPGVNPSVALTQWLVDGCTN